LLNRRSNFVVIEWDFGNQNNIGAARNAAMKRDPPRVTTHHFDDHHPFVARCRGVQTIKRVHYFRDGRIEPERHRRRFDVLSIVFGTPMQLMPASRICIAVVIEPSPPTMTSALTWSSSKTFFARAITSLATTARSPAPTFAIK